MKNHPTDSMRALLAEAETSGRLNRDLRAVRQTKMEVERKVLQLLENMSAPALDLHQETLQDALLAVQRFFSQHAGEVVRVITGRGLHSKNGESVLTPAFQKKFREWQLQGSIISFMLEKKRRKGGAFLVQLR